MIQKQFIEENETPIEALKEQTYKLVRKYEAEDKPEMAKYILLIYLQLDALRTNIDKFKLKS